MKKFRCVFLLLGFLFILLGCSNKTYLKDLSYNEFKNKLNNKESFFFVLVQDGCSHCASYTPKLESILEEYDITAYKINLSKLKDSERKELNELFSYDGTPTTIFVKDGVEESIMQRINGNQPKEKIISKLKNNGYIKG